MHGRNLINTASSEFVSGYHYDTTVKLLYPFNFFKLSAD